MKKGSWILLVAIVLVVAYLLLYGNEFGMGHASLQAMHKQHGMAEGVVAPPTMLQIRSLEAELAGYEETLKARPQTPDAQALLLLVDIEKEAVAAEKNLLEARRNIQGIGLYMPDCSPGGKAVTAKEFLVEVKRHSNRASEQMGTFAERYPVQAQTAGFDSGEDFISLMLGIYEHAEELEEYVDLRCS